MRMTRKNEDYTRRLSAFGLIINTEQPFTKVEAIRAEDHYVEYGLYSISADREGSLYWKPIGYFSITEYGKNTDHYTKFKITVYNSDKTKRASIYMRMPNNTHEPVEIITQPGETPEELAAGVEAVLTEWAKKAPGNFELIIARTEEQELMLNGEDIRALHITSEWKPIQYNTH